MRNKWTFKTCWSQVGFISLWSNADTPINVPHICDVRVKDLTFDIYYTSERAQRVRCKIKMKKYY